MQQYKSSVDKWDNFVLQKREALIIKDNVQIDNWSKMSHKGNLLTAIKNDKNFETL